MTIPIIAYPRRFYDYSFEYNFVSRVYFCKGNIIVSCKKIVKKYLPCESSPIINGRDEAISLRFLASLGMTLRVRLLRRFAPRNDKKKKNRVSKKFALEKWRRPAPGLRLSEIYQK